MPIKTLFPLFLTALFLAACAPTKSAPQPSVDELVSTLVAQQLTNDGLVTALAAQQSNPVVTDRKSVV